VNRRRGEEYKNLGRLWEKKRGREGENTLMGTIMHEEEPLGVIFTITVTAESKTHNHGVGERAEIHHFLATMQKGPGKGKHR